MRRITSILVTAFGLVAIVAGLHALVPNDVRNGAEKTDVEIGGPGRGGREANPPATDEEAPSEASPVKKARTVYGRRLEGEALQPLRRVAPREPLSRLAAPEREPEPIQKRLLPRPIAMDAGHIRIDRATIVLAGIEAPAADARCGEGGAAWPCGARARTALRAYLRGRSVECEAPRDFGDRKETVTSACTLAGEDIASWIVANGWAKAEAGGPYGELETRARNAGRGIWR